MVGFPFGGFDPFAVEDFEAEAPAGEGVGEFGGAVAVGGEGGVDGVEGALESGGVAGVGGFEERGGGGGEEGGAGGGVVVLGGRLLLGRGLGDGVEVPEEYGGESGRGEGSGSCERQPGRRTP